MARPGPAGLKLPREDVVRDYESGDGIQRIGDRYGVCRNTIKRRLIVWGVRLRPRGRPVKLMEVAKAEGVRLRILQLEESIAAKQELVGEREAELKRAQESAPKDAAAVVVKLKKAVSELHDFEIELMTLKEVA